MSGGKTVNCSLGTTNTLRWSEDCELAWATGDYVQIMIPKLRAKFDTAAPRSLDSAIDIISIRTNQFTELEYPLRRAASATFWSIGEEVSGSNAVAIEWSPAGLAKNKKCALGVLTSNLILSIWECNSRLPVARNWERKLCVNHVLREYYLGLRNPCRGQVQQDPIEDDEQLRRRQRVRSFAWSPPIRVSDKQHWSEHLLAVANDNLEIVLIRVQSPYTSVFGQSWSGTVLKHFSVSTERNTVSTHARLYDMEEAVWNRSFATNLSWSPSWKVEDRIHVSVLTFSSFNSIIIQPLRLELTSTGGASLTLNLEKPLETMSSFKGRLTGPMQWERVGPDSADFSLVAFAQDEVKIATLSSERNQGSEGWDMKWRSFDLGDQWDVVTGFTLTRSLAGFVLHYTTHVSTINDSSPSTIYFTPEWEKQDINRPPFWYDQIKGRQSLFSSKNKLHGHAVAKIWGLAASPFGDLVASCATLHPSKLMEYIIEAHDQCFIDITRLSEPDAGRQSILPKKGGACQTQDVSKEAIMFNVKRWMSFNTEMVVLNPKKAMERIMTEIQSCLCLPEGTEDESHEDYSIASWASLGLHPKENPAGQIKDVSQEFQSDPFRDSDQPTPYDADQIASVLRNILLSGTAMRIQRIESMISPLFPTLEQVDPSGAVVLSRIVRTTLDVPSAAFEWSKISRKIIARHKQVLTRLLRMIDQDDSEYELEDCTEECWVCGETGPFEEWEWFRCRNGHQFNRCGITFLSIQEPFVSRTCDFCGRQYLQRNYLERDEADEVDQPGNLPDGRRKATLAELLLAACDLCLHCGGKLAG
ncbi:hypothetical protein K402DRAFT_163099 [Aulographum hederae CBS 113979]|uniref:Transcription factor IIIC putative zinc-finger domain-containing protein n=1 Tax=Aulographum hederae CBS 113979 TaxID=1176131 RepID=A0A6G1GRX9_9PEZI|nr:hypothetical protein K402DRAFT_163099 [Aulographum hederae CBS 113979]